MRTLCSAVLLVLLALGLLAGTASAQSAGPDGERVAATDLIRSSVLVIITDCLVPGDPLDQDPSELLSCNVMGNGSGTIIDPGGRILTNAHVVLSNDMSPEAKPFWVAVAVTEDERSGPMGLFWAKTVGLDLHADVAVIEPVFDFEGEEIGPDDLDLPAIALAESTEDLHIEDSVRLIGFPGVGGMTVTVIESRVAGFMNDPALPEMGNAAWIKTNPAAGPGVSGGTAVNDRGELVGIPTAGAVSPLRCDDLSGDGAVDAAQECVVFGNEVQLVRPIEAAWSLLETLPEPFAGAGDDDGGRRQAPRDRHLPARAAAGDDAAAEEEGDSDAQFELASVTATLVDAETGEPIEEGVIVVLTPGVTFEEFDPENEAHYFTGGISDGDGYVEFINPVERDQPYNVVIAAEGYEPIVLEDTVLATADDPEVVDLGEFELEAM